MTLDKVREEFGNDKVDANLERIVARPRFFGISPAVLAGELSTPRVGHDSRSRRWGAR